MGNKPSNHRRRGGPEGEPVAVEPEKPKKSRRSSLPNITARPDEESPTEPQIDPRALRERRPTRTKRASLSGMMDPRAPPQAVLKPTKAETKAEKEIVKARLEFFRKQGDGSNYVILEQIGKGTYGVVCNAKNVHTGETVAIKRIENCIADRFDSIRILRELKLLRILKHPNVIAVRDVILPASRGSYNDVFVVFEKMDADLARVIRANPVMHPVAARKIMHQLLRALRYLHQANVFHRDLKPENILINLKTIEAKLIDFGLARVKYASDGKDMAYWTDYVATRWYRAPELIHAYFEKYTTAVDIWSAGCIFAELLSGRVLFPGKHAIDQVELITDILGSPTEPQIDQIRSEKARNYLRAMPHKPKKPLKTFFPTNTTVEMDFLQAMLEYDPRQRPSAHDLLHHAYFEGMDPHDEEYGHPPACTKADFDFEDLTSESELRELMYVEIVKHQVHPHGEEASSLDNLDLELPASHPARMPAQFAEAERTASGGGGGSGDRPQRAHEI